MEGFMVSNCANPSCEVPFRFMHSGGVFRLILLEGPSVAGQDVLWDVAVERIRPAAAGCT